MKIYAKRFGAGGWNSKLSGSESEEYFEPEIQSRVQIWTVWAIPPSSQLKYSSHVKVLVQGLALAQLEVTTLVIISCTFILFIIWCHKRFDVRQLVILDKAVDLTVNITSITDSEHIENDAQAVADEHNGAPAEINHSPDNITNAETESAITEPLFNAHASISADNTAVVESSAVINEDNNNELNTIGELSQSHPRTENSEWLKLVPQTDADGCTPEISMQRDTDIERGLLWTIPNTILSVFNTVKDKWLGHIVMTVSFCILFG
ncbi:hypothetical protein BDQ17DRAFT_1323935 [Cyathus striatus]|nr:hypothetical protein BDQ17DRAFT_1323935 [Cyathus striatus]